jgi:purine-cytosine permease-like protein
MFLQFLIASWIGVLLWAQGSQLVSMFSITNNPSILLTFSRFENCVWVPCLLVFVVALGVGAKFFVDTPTAPATAAQIFSFGATIAGNMITWGGISSDYTVYFHPRVSRFVEFRVGQH